MSRIIVKTSDNSDTIFDEELQEIFHSKNGALAESQHVFIKNGFNHLAENKKELKIFEVGFGTGLNAILTLEESLKQDIKTIYHSIEAIPLPESIWSNLNYNDFLDSNSQKIFLELHNLSWNKEHKINENFLFKKIEEKLENYKPETPFDLIYFDAFAPEKQPELWTEIIFSNLYSLLNNQGVLVTYSAKGEVRRDLQKAGFTIEKLAGPPGKREMIRARKNETV